VKFQGFDFLIPVSGEVPSVIHEFQAAGVELVQNLPCADPVTIIKSSDRQSRETNNQPVASCNELLYVYV
jgi:hypothetical protein